MIHPKYYELKAKQQTLIERKNEIDPNFYNGIYDRYIYPILTRHHVPIEWRFDLSLKDNPYFMERLIVNATFNAGAIYFQGNTI
jgi:4-O-beta-D-mannosyl-D-glucose phosphorylase